MAEVARRLPSAERSLEECLTARQRAVFAELMDRLVGEGPLALTSKEEELLAGRAASCHHRQGAR